MVIWADRVREVTTAAFAGTGPVQLNGVPTSPAGRVTFVAGVGSTNTCKFLIDDGAGGWELSEGTVTGGVPDTLSRSRVIKSSAGGALVNFSAGVKDVVLVATSEEFTNLDKKLQQGKHTIVIPSSAMYAAVTNGAEFPVTKETTTNKINSQIFAFDPAIEEFVWFKFVAPKSSDETAGFSVRGTAWEEVVGATAHGLVLGFSMLARGDAEAIDTALGTEVIVADTGAAAGTLYIMPESGVITPGGTWAEGDWLWVRMARKVTDVADTLNVDAWIHGHSLIVTLNANTDV